MINEEIEIRKILKQISAQYLLDPDGIHGLSHWGRVLENGLRLASLEGGDETVITLFALFHDACRKNESVDPGHGRRGAALAKQLLQGHPVINPYQLNLLLQACQEHTNGKTKADLTVQICWDADRLDLARVGIMPKRRRLCTRAAKDRSIMEWANKRALDEFSPSYVKSIWLPNFVID